MTRQNISSGAKWEATIGYSRAVRVGNWVSVAGTTASNEAGEIVGIGDPYEQAIYVFQKIEKALVEAGASLKDVIRTRMYVTNNAHWQQVGRAHGEVFADIRPVATMIIVKALIEPGLLVEIEVDAIIES